MVIINRILIGCSKLVLSSYTKGAKGSAKKAPKPSQKDLSLLSLVANISANLEGKNKFRPFYFRKRLPEDIKKMQSADLTRMLNVSVRTNILKKTQNEARKRGGPSKDDNSANITGRKSFYQYSEYLQALYQVVNKPSARELIFAFLLESKVIHKWLDFICLFALYQLKFSDSEIIDKVHKTSNLPVQQLQNLREKVIRADDEKIKEVAHKLAVNVLRSFEKNVEFFTNLFVMGGIYFYS